VRLHIDTDFARNPDDACALAMVLGWPGVEVVGITTTADPDGRRAGYVGRFLDLAGRVDIPIAAGAGASLTTGGPMGELPDHRRYWGSVAEPARRPASAYGGALDLLASSVDSGATIAALGPWTNLALLEHARPGRLRGVRVVAMGGWVDAPDRDLPAWGPARDSNVQWDTSAAATVASSADLTLTGFDVTLRAHLRAADLPRLAGLGRLGALLARQARAHGEDRDLTRLGSAHPGLPDDLVTILHDPVACAVAVGWPWVSLRERRLRPVLDGDTLRFVEDHPGGRLLRAAVHIDGDAFTEAWFAAVRATTFA